MLRFARVGRGLCLTATLATFFVGRDAEDEGAELAGAQSIALLQAEIEALRKKIRAFGDNLKKVQ